MKTAHQFVLDGITCVVKPKHHNNPNPPLSSGINGRFYGGATQQIHAAQTVIRSGLRWVDSHGSGIAGFDSRVSGAMYKSGNNIPTGVTNFFLGVWSGSALSLYPKDPLRFFGEVASGNRKPAP